MKVKKKTAKVLRAAVAALEQHPEKFDMHDWFKFGPKRLKPKDDKDFCGTACCLAGQIILNDRIEKDDKFRDKLYEYGEVQGDCIELFPKKISIKIGKNDLDYDFGGAAAVIAGIDDVDALALFHCGHWPEPFFTQYQETKKSKQRVKLLKARIEHFIETGE